MHITHFRQERQDIILAFKLWDNNKGVCEGEETIKGKQKIKIKLKSKKWSHAGLYAVRVNRAQETSSNQDNTTKPIYDTAPNTPHDVRRGRGGPSTVMRPLKTPHMNSPHKTATPTGTMTSIFLTIFYLPFPQGMGTGWAVNKKEYSFL